MRIGPEHPHNEGQNSNANKFLKKKEGTFQLAAFMLSFPPFSNSKKHVTAPEERNNRKAPEGLQITRKKTLND